MNLSIRDFLSKCDEIQSFLGILSHLLKKSLMENLIFCVATRTGILNYTYFHCKCLSTKVLENFKDLLNSVRKPALSNITN